MTALRVATFVTLAALGVGLAVAVDSRRAPAAPAAPMQTLIDRACACRDAACGDRVMNDVMEDGKRRRGEPSTDAEAQAWVDAFQQIHACVARVAAPSEPPAPPARPAIDDRERPSSVGVAECDAYLARLEVYLDCRAIPPHVRTSAREGAAAMARQWAAAEPSDDARAAMQDHCRGAHRAIAQSASALGCRLDD